MADLVQILTSKELLAERPVQPEVILCIIVKDSDPLRHHDHRREGEHGYLGPSCTPRSRSNRLSPLLYFLSHRSLLRNVSKWH